MLKIIAFLFDFLFFSVVSFSIIKFSDRFFVENYIALKKIGFFLITYKLFFNYFFDLYEFDKRNDKFFIFFKSLQAVILSSILIGFTTFYIRNFALPRSFIAITAFFDLMFLFFTRIFYASFYTSQNIGVVFSNEDDFEFIKKELKEYNPSVKIMKLGRDYNEIKEVIKKKRADKIIFTSEMVKDFSFVVRLYWYAVKNGISLLLFPSVSEAFIAKIDFSGVNGLPFINIGSKIGIVERFVKRIVDFIISVSVLILFSPFFLIIAFFIKFDTPGPVFYVQERIGKDGKKFKLYKFRTMVKDAEASTGPTLALPDDKRITKVGKILRKYRIDELPQFINVFLGDMSIVGPRPEREVFIKKFYTKLPGYFIRTTVKPGITGLAQIYGGYYTKPEDKLKFDFIYINNYSLFLDFKIMFLTFFQLLFAKGR